MSQKLRKFLSLFLILFPFLVLPTPSVYSQEPCDSKEGKKPFSVLENQVHSVEKTIGKYAGHELTLFESLKAISHVENEAQFAQMKLDGLAELSREGRRTQKAFHLTDEDVLAIRFYTEYNYSSINPLFRNRDPRIEPFRRVMNRALNKLPAFRGKVLRGVSLPAHVLESHQVGSIITYDAVTSTTKSPSVVKTQFRSRNVIEIESRTGRDISTLADREYEKEIVFAPGTRFKVLDRFADKTGTRIVLQEVTSPLD